MKCIKDNEIYQTPLCEKVIYPTKATVSLDEVKELNEKYNIKVKEVSKTTKDPFMLILDDLKSQQLPSTGKLPNYISVECGPTVTGPLYSLGLNNPRVIDILFLTRYIGPVRQDALGPIFSNLSEISRNYKLMSSYKEETDDK